MKHSLLAALLLGCVTPPTFVQTETPACVAAVFVSEDLQKEPRVKSPDGRYAVLLGVRREDDEDGWLHVYRGSDVVGRFELHELSAGIFVNWAPDSGAFYVMWSSGGTIGGYNQDTAAPP